MVDGATSIKLTPQTYVNLSIAPPRVFYVKVIGTYESCIQVLMIFISIRSLIQLRMNWDM